MNTRELENAILLRDSGELSEAECQELDQALEKDPALAAFAEEVRVLMHAGTFSTNQTVPPLPDQNRERILLSHKKPAVNNMPRILALAALLVLGLGLLPHLSRKLQPAPQVYITEIEPLRPTLDSEDPVLSTLENLETELALWTLLHPEDPDFLENENDWATALLSPEDSI